MDFFVLFLSCALKQFEGYIFRKPIKICNLTPSVANDNDKIFQPLQGEINRIVTLKRKYHQKQPKKKKPAEGFHVLDILQNAIFHNRL